MELGTRKKEKKTDSKIGSEKKFLWLIRKSHYVKLFWHQKLFSVTIKGASLADLCKSTTPPWQVIQLSQHRTVVVGACQQTRCYTKKRKERKKSSNNKTFLLCVVWVWSKAFVWTCCRKNSFEAETSDFVKDEWEREQSRLALLPSHLLWHHGAFDQVGAPHLVHR